MSYKSFKFQFDGYIVNLFYEYMYILYMYIHSHTKKYAVVSGTVIKLYHQELL